MQVFSTYGESGFSGTWASITAAKGFNTNILNIPLLATHYVRYTTGATAALKVGETLTGGSSSAKIYLAAQAVENGSAGSGDSGILFVYIISGTPTNETFTGGTSTGTVVTAQSLIPIKHYGPPKAALISVETASVNFTTDGTTPTTTATTNYGHNIVSGGSVVLVGQGNIYNFKVINASAGSGSVVKYSLYY